jgi:hypothetical protein
MPGPQNRAFDQATHSHMEPVLDPAGRFKLTSGLRFTHTEWSKIRFSKRALHYMKKDAKEWKPSALNKDEVLLFHEKSNPA